MKRRTQKINEFLKSEVGTILDKDLEFNGMLVTVTGAEVSENLQTAKILFSVMPEDRTKDAGNILKKMRGRIQYLLNKKMHFRVNPEIKFLPDTGLSKEQKVRDLLKEIESEAR